MMRKIGFYFENGAIWHENSRRGSKISSEVVGEGSQGELKRVRNGLFLVADGVGSGAKSVYGV